ncbi:MAG: hypothetical protein PVG59_14950 [Desulfobacterales bacterium]|jgi:hypothetical protein
MKAAAAALDDEKRKSIEAAEAILDETQPPADIDTPIKETIRRPDPHEDTVEIRVPKPEEIPPLEAEPSDSEAPELEENTETQHAEIELDTIETSIETVTEPDTTKSPFSEEIKAEEPPKPAADDSAEGADQSSGDPQKTADASAETDNTGSVGEKSRDSRADDRTAEKPEDEPVAAGAVTESTSSPESESKASAFDISAETDASVQQSVKPVEADAITTPKNEGQPDELEIQLKEDVELKTGGSDANRAGGQAGASASPESTDKMAGADAQVEQAAQKARKEALIKQQEALLKAQARKKEEAAQAKAAALRKKKLVRARAEALKKQKAAQAKAEALKKKKAARVRALALKKKKADQAKADALKKQKAAQTRAEESAENVEVAAGQSNYVKLLGLLKRYKGKAIGINYDNSAEIKEAELVEANEEFFSVMVKEKKVQYSYPLKTILTIVEGEQGVVTGEDDKKAKFDAVIKVYPLVLF